MSSRVFGSENPTREKWGIDSFVTETTLKGVKPSYPHQNVNNRGPEPAQQTLLKLTLLVNMMNLFPA